MMNGDISNQAGITIGFRCINMLVYFREDGIRNKILNGIFGKVRRAEIDKLVKDTMEYIYRNTEYNVDLIIENKDYTADLKNLLDEMPFNRIVLIDKVSQITSRLLTGDLSYYIDNDDLRRNAVNSKYALSLEELGREIPIKTRRVKRNGV